MTTKDKLIGENNQIHNYGYAPVSKECVVKIKYDYTPATLRDKIDLVAAIALTAAAFAWCLFFAPHIVAAFVGASLGFWVFKVFLKWK